MVTEVWKPIIGYKGYEVSNRGRIHSCRDRRRLPNKKVSRDGWTILKQIKFNSAGYKTVNIRSSEKGRFVTRFVHRLVLETFVGAAHGLECRHLNGVTSDNDLSNLKWGTTKENADDRVRHGTDRTFAKLTWSKVRKIRDRHAQGELTKDLAENFQVHPCTISRIIHLRSWIEPDFVQLPV